ncbi:uncharacterized protein B0H18DRAFT_1049185 [Fomitopsis serialis]|uniref:uncharacterized protein n=1 Tax=Fomitopsis serialis TaxID=139415 RepID=UPI002007DA58|nr:uncharacterized protein B0H18DRAFT_1049185 [Neoantrodia serialis]KAH9913363.1 hypothetical protein B0H18DRAFT_1049185 [Neoantrodia serialis]
MSTRAPMWYCHEVPDPHCASCNGTFVEMLENTEDDPREFQHVHEGFDEDALPANMDGFLAGLRSLLQGPDREFAGRPTPPTASQGNRPDGSGIGVLGGGNGLTIRIQGSPDGRSRTMIIGGGAAGRRDSQGRGDQGQTPPLLSEFLRGSQTRQDGGPGIAGPLMAQYLLAILGNRPGAGMDGFFPLMGMPGGADDGRWGDYVFNQEALDQIITQIMENSNSGHPIPATEAIMAKLPRECSRMRDCAICKDQFKADAEEETERIVVTLPCKHPFHEPCIIPWLKSSGTCPVCRYQLVPQPEHHAPGSPPPRGSSSGGPSGSASRSPPGAFPGSSSSPPSSPRQRPASPGGSSHNRNGSGGPSLFSSIFAGQQRSDSGSRTRGARSNSSPSPRDHIPGSWGDHVD